MAARLEDKVIAEFYKYRTDYDGYTVYFENTKQYTKKEVRRIFTKYGAVRKVAQSEVYLCSHCFVAFVTEEDVRKCVQGMNTSGDIQLLTITRGRTRPPHLLDRHRGRPGNNPHPIPVGMKKVKNAKSEGKKRPQAALNGQSAVQITPKVVKSVDTRCIRQVKPPETMTSAGNVNVDDNIEENIDFNANHLDNSPQTSDSHSEFSILQHELRKEVIMFLGQLLRGMPQVIQKVMMVDPSGELGKSFYVPMKSRVPWHMLRSVRVEEVQAYPVVIANIHDICNEKFIMELFGLYEPLLASKMKIIAGTNMRYCCVYFMSAKCADSVQRIYDDMRICGNCLVVKRVGGME